MYNLYNYFFIVIMGQGEGREMALNGFVGLLGR
jgi:hypothetical protein